MKENILDQDLNDKKQDVKFKTTPVIIWGAITIFAILLRTIEFPGGVALLVISSAILYAHCLVGFVMSKLRNTLNITLSIIGTLWFLTIIGGVFFNNGNPYNERGLFIFIGISLVYFTIYYFVLRRRLR
ncbi:MAG: hypothetical protein COA32_16465 [Fluviicola sp.]|nr:MAG: hypothetical protein COA32_16465 [Fluviicola sp.]